jgi:hypothetical protein
VSIGASGVATTVTATAASSETCSSATLPPAPPRTNTNVKVSGASSAVSAGARPKAFTVGKLK